MFILHALLLVAADPSPSPTALVEAVEACRGIAESTARLACFDRATAAMAEARARRELLVMDKTEVRKTRRSLFGFSIPSFRLFGGSEKDDAEEEIKQIDGKVAAAVPSGFNEIAITLGDGTVWQTSDHTSSFDPRDGDKITIKRSAFGYVAKSGYGQAQVRRVR